MFPERVKCNGCDQCACICGVTSEREIDELKRRVRELEHAALTLNEIASLHRDDPNTHGSTGMAYHRAAEIVEEIKAAFWYRHGIDKRYAAK